MGPLEKNLREKLKRAFAPTYLELENESHTHCVPKNSETHFRALIVSEKFLGVSRVARQRLVLDSISVEMKNGVHAFTMRCLVPSEYDENQSGKFVSPDCHGGSKREAK